MVVNLRLQLAALDGPRGQRVGIGIGGRQREVAQLGHQIGAQRFAEPGEIAPHVEAPVAPHQGLQGERRALGPPHHIRQALDREGEAADVLGKRRLRGVVDEAREAVLDVDLVEVDHHRLGGATSAGGLLSVLLGRLSARVRRLGCGDFRCRGHGVTLLLRVRSRREQGAEVDGALGVALHPNLGMGEDDAVDERVVRPGEVEIADDHRVQAHDVVLRARGAHREIARPGRAPRRQDQLSLRPALDLAEAIAAEQPGEPSGEGEIGLVGLDGRLARGERDLHVQRLEQGGPLPVGSPAARHRSRQREGRRLRERPCHSLGFDRHVAHGEGRGR